MQRILIVSGCRYPNGDAGAIRIHIFAKLFALCGYTPMIIGRGQPTHGAIQSREGISYVSFRTGANPLLQLLSRFFYRRQLAALTATLTDLAAVMVVDIPFSAFRWLKRYTRNNAIPLVHESVEWYSPCEFRTGIFNREYLHNAWLNTRMIDAHTGVIAISRYLEKHFVSRGCPTLRIPVILDAQSAPVADTPPDNADCIISYIGNPGNKDRLYDIVAGFLQAQNETPLPAQLHIVGCTQAQCKGCDALLARHSPELTSKVTFHGRLPHAEALRILEQSDFTILLRHGHERYAKAGFPTKIVESLMHGVPVITDLSSDLAEYMRDGENCFVIENDVVAAAVRRAAATSPEERQAMCRAARQTGEEHFDYRLYRDQTQAFLDRMEKEKQKD